jgi:hypothetical protein
MNRQEYTRSLLLVMLILAGAGFPGLSGVEDSRPDARRPDSDPLDQFFAAEDPRAAGRAAERLLTARIGFDALWRSLKSGRRYDAARAGTHQYRFALEGVIFENEIEIPAEYDPARRWPVRVQLHGGVNRPVDAPRRGRQNSLRGETPQIYVYPRAWRDAQWVAGESGCQYPARPRQAEAAVQRRRITRVHHRFFGWRHRRVFLRHARADALLRDRAAAWPYWSTRESACGRRRPDVSW